MQSQAETTPPLSAGVGVAHGVRFLGTRSGPSLGRAAAYLVPAVVEPPPANPSLGHLNEAGSTGLVSLRTSDTSERITLGDGHLRRLRRMRRGIKTHAGIMQEALTGAGFRFRGALITVTYAPGSIWAPRHISDLVKSYREWCNRRGFRFRYAWVLELQRNGAPHYHLVLWLPRGITPPKPDAQGWWKHGMSNCKWARSPIGYICKYASKGYDAAASGGLPRGARVFGTGGLEPVDQARWCHAMAPLWLRYMVPEGHKITRKRSGWWLDATARIYYRSPWEFDGFGDDGCGRLRWRGYHTDDIVFEVNDGPPHDA